MSGRDPTNRSRTGRTLTAVALGVASACAASAGGARDGVFPGWDCSLCAPSTGWEVDAAFGPGYVSEDAFAFGDYTGLDEKGTYLFGDAFARWWGKDASYLRLDAYRLGQDSRTLFVEGGRQGDYEVRAGYQEIPRRIHETTVTPFLGVGSADLTLPAGWDRQPSTGQMSGLDASLRPVQIERDWQVASLGATVEATTRWSFDLDYRHQEREGNAIQGGSFFLNSAQLIKPVDYATDEVEASASYAGERWQLGFGYGGSVFQNDHDRLRWENPYSPAPLVVGQDFGELAQAPDNESHRAFVSGSALLPARTTISGQVSLGRMTQDEALLPYTTTQIATSALPRDSADAEVDTAHADLRVTSSPLRRLTLQGAVRYDDRDNRTPVAAWDYVSSDQFNPPGTVENLPYDYERLRYEVSAEYRLERRSRLGAGYDFERMDRSLQERDRTETDRIWVRASSRPARAADIAVELYQESRDGSDYVQVPDARFPQNELMRKYNMADRERDGIKLLVSVNPSERATVGVELEQTEDDYDESLIGLLESEYRRYGLDLSYLFGRQISAYAGLYLEDVDSLQANSQGFADPDWQGRTQDRYWTTTVGLRVPRLTSRLSASFELNRARSTGDIDIETGGSVSSFPTLRSDLQQFRLGLDYRVQRAWLLSLAYWYEDLSTRDWALEGVEPDTVNNLLSTSADPFDYEVHGVFLGARFLFDSRGEAAPPRPRSYPY